MVKGVRESDVFVEGGQLFKLSRPFLCELRPKNRTKLSLGELVQFLYSHIFGTPRDVISKSRLELILLPSEAPDKKQGASPVLI